MAPRRPFRERVARRWLGNLGMIPFDLVLVHVLFTAGATLALAVLCARERIGLLHALPAPLPTAAQVAMGFVALDLCMWLQHWLQHKIPLLWRSHRVHHTDLDLDVTTAFRFHPFEAVFTVACRLAFIAALGLPLLAVIVYEVALELVSSAGHASLRLPERLDALARRVVVTPDFHRVHHSARAPEMERNFASVFPVWDRVFGTYCAQPEKGHLDMELGLPGYRAPLHLAALLLLPFRRSPPA